MRNNFAKDHIMIKCTVYDSLRYIQTNIHFYIYRLREVTRPLQPIRPFCSYIRQSSIQNLRTLAVAVYDICDVKYLLGMWYRKQPIVPSRHTGRYCENFKKIGPAVQPSIDFKQTNKHTYIFIYKKIQYGTHRPSICLKISF